MNAFKRINIYLHYSLSLYSKLEPKNAIFIDEAFLKNHELSIDFREKSKHNFSSTFFKRVVKIYGVY